MMKITTTDYNLGQSLPLKDARVIETLKQATISSYRGIETTDVGEQSSAYFNNITDHILFNMVKFLPTKDNLNLEETNNKCKTLVRNQINIKTATLNLNNNSSSDSLVRFLTKLDLSRQPN